VSRRERPRSEGKDAGQKRRACCMVSELLEESGIDREHIRRVRKQVLQGIILLCQWQIERMDETQARSPATGRRGAAGGRGGRNISVE
jgi:hypothetical protein